MLLRTGRSITLDFYRDGNHVPALPSTSFCSVWKSASAGEEWIYVDLGAPAEYDKINLYWINKAIKGVVQASDDAKIWTSIVDLPGGDGRKDVIELNKTVRSPFCPFAAYRIRIWSSLPTE